MFRDISNSCALHLSKFVSFAPGIRIGLYSSIKELLHGKDAVGEPSFGVKLLSGAGSGGIGSAIATPIDVVRLRMQAEAGTIRNGLLVSGLFKGNKPRYPNTFAAFRVSNGLFSQSYSGLSVLTFKDCSERRRCDCGLVARYWCKRVEGHAPIWHTTWHL